ncbi:MAG: trans-aconitate 2-methyltransferase [Rhodospirillaceae bacterium]|jgi:SAM-dependent methyltransferase
MNTPAPPDVDYNAVWTGAWDDMRRYGPMARHSRRLMRRMTDDLNPASILDIGGGEGSLLQALSAAHPNAKMTGTDLAATAVELARKQMPQAEFAVLDVVKDRLPARFDLVVCADVVEHIDDDQSALNNMAAMTNAGGHVVVATLQGRMRNFEKDVGHVRNYIPGELEEKMRRAGLVIDRVIAWGFPFYAPLYRDFLDMTGSKGTTGKFGLVRRLICHGLYMLFLLNRHTRGDYLFVRARKP